MFTLKAFNDYPDPLHDKGITLEDIFGVVLAAIKHNDYDNQFVKEMIAIWNDKYVFGKRRLCWIVIRHFQYLKMTQRDTQQVWHHMKYGESLIHKTKEILD